MKINAHAQPKNLQTVEVLFLRKQGEEFYSKERPESMWHKGMPTYTMVCNIFPGEHAKLQLPTFTNETYELDCGQLPATVVLPHAVVEYLQKQPNPAIIAKFKAQVNISASDTRLDMETNEEVENTLKGNLWLEPDFNGEIDIAPAPQRSAALDEDTLRAIVTQKKNDSLAARLKIANEAGRVARSRVQSLESVPDPVERQENLQTAGNVVDADGPAEEIK